MKKTLGSFIMFISFLLFIFINKISDPNHYDKFDNFDAFGYYFEYTINILKYTAILSLFFKIGYNLVTINQIFSHKRKHK